MNKELETLGVEAIKGLLDTLTTAKAFAIEQAPEVVREIVLLGRITCTLGTVVALVCVGLGISFLRRGNQRNEEGYQLSGILITAIAGMVTLGIGYQTILVWFAPRLYIIQTLKDML